MSKTIMVLPGTLWQMALIDKIKELGHRAIVVNPAPDSPAFSHADDHLQSDIFNRPAVIKYGKENHVDGVMSDQCDIAMNLIAELGQEFKVPTLDTETASLFTDKFKMREFCREHQLPYPEYKLCKTADEAIELLVRIGKPIIIKPLDSNASHGVFKCETPENIRKHFDDSMSFSRVEKYVLAERFITGTEFTIDSVKTPHGHYPLAISQKHHFAHNPNIANQLFFTHDNPNYDYDELRRVNNAFVNQTNLQFGFTHAEYRYENGQFYLLEIGARGGGGLLSSHVVPALTGIDNYKILIDMFVGNPVTTVIDPQSLRNNRVAMVKFFDTSEEGGVVKNIKGRDFLDAQPSILHWQLNFKEGDRIKRPTDGGNRIGYYIACTDGPDAMTQLEEQVDNHFVIEYE